LKNRKPSLAVVFPESNSAALAVMDTANLDDALDLMTREPAEVLIILENDLYRRLLKENADRLFEKCRQIVVIDHLLHATARKAHLVLPAATWTESSGTIVNHEGRAQRYYPVLPVSNPVRESWQWIIDILHTAGSDHEASWTGFDDLVNSLTHYFPAFAAIKNQLPNSVFRFHNEKIARQTLRFSGRTAITAEISVSEPGPPQDFNSPLNFSMEGYKGRPPANLIPYYWFPGWNSPQAVNKYLDKPNGSVEDGDPGVSILENKTAILNQYIINNPSLFKAAAGELYLLPVYLVFGSEELSAHGQAISNRIPSPFVLMNEKDAARWKVNANDFFNLVVGGSTVKVQIRTDNAIPDGVAGLTVLLPGMDHLDLPALAKITGDSEKLTHSLTKDL